MSKLSERLRMWANDPLTNNVLEADLLAAAEALEKETKRLEWLMAHGLAYVWRGSPRYSVELTFRNRDELDKAIKEETGFND